MMDTFKGDRMQFVHYMKFSPKELHNALIKRNLQPLMVEHIKRTVREQQLKLRAEKSKEGQLKFYWQQINAPLKAEIKIVRSMLSYKTWNPNEKRIEALEVYAGVLNELRVKFRLYELRDKILPTQLAKEKNLPNRGIHWVDWVPEKIKTRVYELFADIPPKAKAKQKEPFMRTIPITLNADLRERLHIRTSKELDNEVSEQEIEYDEKRALRIEQMKRALYKIDKLPLTDPIPYTWHGLED
jgi:hypothetical protein